MGYIVYINSNKIDVVQSTISFTRQVNDIAQFENRNSSLSSKIIAPFTPANTVAMQFVFMPGNVSDLPYQLNSAQVFDADSGECIIRNGIAVFSPTKKTGYEFIIYDGIISFYQLLENKVMTDLGITDLNHAKSITNVIASWGMNLPYVYCLADYNGKNSFAGVGINLDYQVPSAKMSYLWDKVFEFTGYTYSGSFFNTVDFTNWLITFPKPVPKTVPNRILLYEGNCNPLYTVVGYYEGYALFYRNSYLRSFPRENFANAYTSVTNALQQVPLGSNGNATLGYGYVGSDINVLQNCSLIIDAYTTATVLKYYRSNSAGVFQESGDFILDESGTFVTAIMNCLAGDKIRTVITGTEGQPTPDFDWKLHRVDGYTADFSNAFLDFAVMDFVKEVVQDAGLTPYIDLENKHIEFKTVKEVLRNPAVEDWSSKFQHKDNERYRFGNYAKRNWFRRQYNKEKQTHSDYYFPIGDENLPETKDLVVSKIYSSERGQGSLSGIAVPIMPIWEKELQDDGTIEYKDLDGRFYFTRLQTKTASFTIGSETLNDSQTVESAIFAWDVRLKYQYILATYYDDLQSVVDRAKLLDGYFYLTPLDIAKFDFKKLIFIEQLSSYYLVNKILNFKKGVITKCEIMEVDYQKSFGFIPTNYPTFITITNLVVTGCQVVFDYTTDAQPGTLVNVYCEVNSFGLPVFTPPDASYGYTGSFFTTAETGTFSFTLNRGSFYTLRLTTDGENGTINSNILSFENNASCQVASPTTLVITDVNLVSTSGIVSIYDVFFDTDAGSVSDVYHREELPFVLFDPQNPFGGGLGGWTGFSGPSAGQPQAVSGSYKITYAQGSVTGAPIKFQIKIGNKESNEFAI